ncbi:hypothetical protein E2C01_021306 [Portunus trituberculatus]|uniref:Uncharacterized protein n=1 Tax=Portunus trituberculatus TaxID=210409 RepID=A0A5B7E2C3_PORTR|nr:hypothetical protein [Portunus trituberculatus]
MHVHTSSLRVAGDQRGQSAKDRLLNPLRMLSRRTTGMAELPITHCPIRPPHKHRILHQEAGVRYKAVLHGVHLSAVHTAR